PENINGWVDDNDDVKEEDDENEDVDIEEDDDAEIIFPYEVQGDQTPPPRDESSNSEFKTEEADVELKVEEAGVKLELEEAGAKIGKMERFYLEMVRKEAVPKLPSDDEGSERPRNTSKKSDRDEGPSDPRGPLIECKEKDRVKFAMATLRGRALTWWNGRTKAMGIEAANNTPWSEVKKWMTEDICPRSVIQRMEQELYILRMKGMDIDGYTNRFHELALLCLRMVEPEAVKVEQYLWG
nr:hypothetical protein [Tanacetum cinerariifolium]